MELDVRRCRAPLTAVAAVLLVPVAWSQELQRVPERADDIGGSTFKCDVTRKGIYLPVKVNGVSVNWLADTGASITIISDAEAARLRLAVGSTSSLLWDGEGNAVPASGVITAPSFSIGGTELRDVPIVVTPSDLLPWEKVPVGRQGIIGLPVLRALGALQWEYYGVCRTGEEVIRAEGAKSSPLHLEGSRIIAAVRADAASLQLFLDTGSLGSTQLWTRFAEEFESLVKEKGLRATYWGGSVAGRSYHRVTSLSDFRLLVGDKPVLLEEVFVFDPGVGDDRFHGVLGMEILDKAAEVILDFDKWTLTLR